jgi:ribose-phosphate pyrophosphokinase
MAETMMKPFSLFAGTANPKLAKAIASQLKVPLGQCTVERFPDGEMSVRLNEPVREKGVFIVQPISPPVNEHLVELLLFADACRRAAARTITALVPYLGYARSDKRHGRREAIGASMVAGLLQSVGITHLVTVDVHSPQIEGFFHAPVDSLTAVPALCSALEGHLPEHVVVVAPDAGAMHLASEYAHRLQTSVIVLHKRRQSGTSTRVTHLVGDVRDRPCLIVDDMISTGGTIAESIEVLLDAGAYPSITVAATHGLFVKDAREMMAHESLQNIFVTDTIAPSIRDWPQLKVVSIAPLIAGALRRFISNGSISDLY